MSQKLLGIIGSPRKHGNSELFIKEIFTAFPTGWELELLRLPEWNIRPCRACYQCLFDRMRCPQRDDFPQVLEALAASNAYVVAAPTYLLAANASLKLFLDRGLSFYGHVDRLWGKPAAGVAIAGIPGMEGSTKLDVESFVKLTFGDLRASAVIYGALPGEIFFQGDTKHKAAQIAGSLLRSPTSSDSDIPCCPVCGGDTFRFLPGRGLRCMLCSSEGRYEPAREGLKIHTQPGEHALFTTRDAVLRHAEWLRQMKDRFMERRQDLKEVTRPYASMGSWLRPEDSRKKSDES